MEIINNEQWLIQDIQTKGGGRSRHRSHWAGCNAGCGRITSQWWSCAHP